MEIKVGDIYIRHSDGQICRVKWVDSRAVVLQAENERHLRLTNILALEEAYSKRPS